MDKMLNEIPQAEQSACGKDSARDEEVFISSLGLMKDWVALQDAKHEQLVIGMQIINTKLDMLMVKLGINVSNNNNSHGNQEPGK